MREHGVKVGGNAQWHLGENIRAHVPAVMLLPIISWALTDCCRVPVYENMHQGVPQCCHCITVIWLPSCHMRCVQAVHSDAIVHHFQGHRRSLGESPQATDVDQ